MYIYLMYYFHITRVSSNSKTGPIPVTTSSKNTCPITCSFKGNGCYAESGPLNLHWNKVSSGDKRALNIDQFIEGIKGLPNNTLWRHNQAGDIPADDKGHIDELFIKTLTLANKKGRKRGFTYTRHVHSKHNIRHIKYANSQGFTVNLSADNARDSARVFKEYGLPTVTALPMNAPNIQTIDNVKIVACPAEKNPKINCANCGLCAVSKRDYVIGFRAHGIQKKKADIIASG